LRDFTLYSSFKLVRKFNFCLSHLVKRYTLEMFCHCNERTKSL